MDGAAATPSAEEQEKRQENYLPLEKRIMTLEIVRDRPVALNEVRAADETGIEYDELVGIEKEYYVYDVSTVDRIFQNKMLVTIAFYDLKIYLQR